MGIKSLSQLIMDHAPGAVVENEFKNYFGRKVAIDASMSLYQFLIAVRQDGDQLTGPDGEPTSHLSGFFYRTIRMVEAGIKPVYVFDGKPPQMKAGELEKRHERREEAQKALDDAKETGTTEDIDKQSRRLVKVSKSHVEEAQKLLTFMGIPFIKAPCEAEAQCAELQKNGKVYGVATEDMDALTFGTKILLRHLTFSEMRKMPIREFYLDKVLEGLGLTMDEFIDLCILLGCDYCDSIRGIGPKKAIEFIKEYHTIENILQHLKQVNKEKLKKDPEKGVRYVLDEDWPYEQARVLFKTPEVTDADEFDLKWSSPDVDGLVAYMCQEKGFSEDRMRKGCEKLVKAKGTSTQGRLDGFFKVLGTTTAAKRPADDKKSKEKDNPKKKARGGGGGGGGRRGGR